MNPRDDRTPSDLLDDLLHYADYFESTSDRKDWWWEQFNQLKALENGVEIGKRLLRTVKGKNQAWRYDDSGFELLKEHILTGGSGPDGCEEIPLGTTLSVRKYPDRICIVRRPGRDTEDERVVIACHLDVEEHLSVDGNDFWRVRLEKEALVSFESLSKQLRRSGRVLSRRDLDDVLSTVLGECSNHRVSHATFGVYNHDGKLLICTDPIPVKPEQVKAWEMVRGLVEREATKEEIQTYVETLGYWHSYEILPLLGLALIAPFAIFLRQNQILLVYVFNYAPEMDLGKSLVQLILTEKLYGYKSTSGQALNAPYRLASQLDAICLPRTVEEAELLKKSLWPTLKESAERELADQRGTRDLDMLDYFSRATLFFNGNSLPIDSEAVLKRFLVPRFDSSAKLNRSMERSKRLQELYNSLQPIGFQLLRWAVREWPTAEEFLSEFREIEKAIRNARQEWASPKRPETWTCAYMGLKILDIGCREMGVDWRIPSVTKFTEDVINPIETQTWGMRRTHVDRFAAWFDMWRAEHTYIVKELGEIVKGEGELFKEDSIAVGEKTVRGWWVKWALLDKYNQTKDGEERISSLKDLSTQAADIMGLPYDAILDKKDKPKVVRYGKGTDRSAFVPADLSEALSKEVQTKLGNGVTDGEPDTVTSDISEEGSGVTDQPGGEKEPRRYPVTQESPTPVTQSEQSLETLIRKQTDMILEVDKK